MKKLISRRGFLSSSSILAAAGAATVKSKKACAYPGFATEFEPQGKQFMDQYYDGIMNILRGIRDSQVDNIAEAMEKAYELKKNGGTLYSNVFYGHFAGYAGSKDRPGQPWVLPQYISLSKEQLDSMKEGDFLLTDYVDEDRLNARERGVYVVGITNNYIKFYKTPPEALVPQMMKLSLNDISNHVIDSYVPWDNGLVSAPQIPKFKICPSSGITQFLVYWSCTASLANLIGTVGKGSSSEPVRQYLDLAIERCEQIGTDRPKIDRVAAHWADLVLEKQARLLVYGEPFTASEDSVGNMFVSDAVGCASGSMIAQPFKDDVSANDIVFIGSVRSNQAQEIEVAHTARRKGAYTVAFCPYSTEGDASGVRLFKEVDHAFNTYCDEREGVIAVHGFEKKVSPLTGITGNIIHWMLTAQWTDHMARRGEMPYYWQGFHENGGREYDDMVRPYFEKRGY